ncbi:hypothetical protein HNY73_021338 [Argiope bruennichi]|uniref:DUF5641 domain-containing protein n=1 Tax=Argiope bruennichi TaxID=94029 RepID=A0A8T0DY96_ARGBR|nr:hypothetical protein HNY73_021338 [Argiope bruennichi]
MLVHKGRHTRDESLNVGDIILLETDGKRLHWPLGIVLKSSLEQMGHSRVARERKIDLINGPGTNGALAEGWQALQTRRPYNSK